MKQNNTNNNTQLQFHSQIAWNFFGLWQFFVNIQSREETFNAGSRCGTLFFMIKEKSFCIYIFKESVAIKKNPPLMNLIHNVLEHY